MSHSLPLDSKLRCGLMLAGVERDPILHLARRAEALNFDSLWVGDHVSFHIPILDSLTLLAFAAGATERVELGSAVYLLPLRHPTITAKVASSLDVLCGGRLTLGIGVGGEFPPEFEACGIPLAERGPRTDETIPLLRRLWSENGVAQNGRFFQFGPVSLDPKPVQPGGPPILVGGRKGPSMRRAGQLGDGYVSHMASAEHIRANLDEIAKHAEQAGRKLERFQTASLLFTVLDPSYEAALDRAAQMLGTIYNRPFRDAASKYCLLGRPEDCLEQLAHFAAAGSRHFLLSPLSDPAEFVERVGEELLPQLDQIQL